MCPKGYIKANGVIKSIVDGWVKVGGEWKGRILFYEKQPGGWTEVLTVKAPSAPSFTDYPVTVHMLEDIELSWSSAVGVLGYSLERSVNGGEYEEIYNGMDTSYVEEASLEWETVQYRIRAYNNAGFSGYRTTDVVVVYGIRIPVGMIVPWAGTAAEIPEGWALCDGNNGTPNLVGRFVIGGATGGETGGSSTHSHTINTGGNHAHSLGTASSAHRHYLIGHGYCRETDTGVYTDYQGSHSHSTSNEGGHDHGGATDSISAEPVHYELAFIMKVG